MARKAMGFGAACGALALLALFALAPAQAATLSVQGVDADGKPVPDAVVSLHGATPAQADGTRVVMDQRETTFMPGVLPIQAGTSVSFPNSDSVQHQVYSFSPARPFELPLYAGTPPAPVLFDKPGVVTVGCNIHDGMIGWIVVLDTPYFARTGATGTVPLQAPDGAYRLRVWHPRLLGTAPDEAVALAADGSRKVQVAIGPPPAERRVSDRLRCAACDSRSSSASCSRGRARTPAVRWPNRTHG